MRINHFTCFLCLWTISGSLFLTNSAASPPSDPFPDNHIWPLLEIREEIGGETVTRAVTQNDLSSPFGSRLKASEGFRYDFHRAIDIPTERGTPDLICSYCRRLMLSRHRR